MPELPEVETVVRELRQSISGKNIEEIQAVWHKTVQNLTEKPADGQTIQSISRKGKYIQINLNNSSLIIHLRMTGNLLFMNTENGSENHIRAKIMFDDGSLLAFKDMRKFGRIYHVDDADSVLAKIGVDALDPQLKADDFLKMLKQSKMNIKAFLLSQKYISGLGNIYVDESLFRSNLHPAVSAAKINNIKGKRLFSNMIDVLNFAVDNMGSTISDYRNTEGNPGTNQLFFKVYQRQNLPCRVCGTNVKKIKFAGRGTHFCPKCQKTPKGFKNG